MRTFGFYEISIKHSQLKYLLEIFVDRKIQNVNKPGLLAYLKPGM